MQKTNVVLGILAISFFFSSCKKNSTVDSVNVNPPITTSNNSYLSKAYDIEINGSVIDTLHLVTYNFDSEKRVIEITDSTNFASPYIRDKFYYNGAERLPYKSTRRMTYDPSLYDSTTCLFNYNLQGKLVKNLLIRDNITYAPDTVIYNYSYTGTSIYAKFDYSIFNGMTREIFYSRDTALLNNDGDILNCVTHDSRIPYVTQYSYTFDNHSSPYTNLTTNQAYYILEDGGFDFWQLPQKSNWLFKNRTSNVPGVGNYLLNYSGGYTYNLSGYPTQRIHTEAGVTSKQAFVYKNL